MPVARRRDATLSIGTPHMNWRQYHVSYNTGTRRMSCIVYYKYIDAN
jgi:hypothetical protein